MKKFIIAVCILVVAAFGAWYAYFHLGIYVNVGGPDEVSSDYR